MYFAASRFGEKRRRAVAVQDAGARNDGVRIARSVLECASPLVLWPDGRRGAAGKTCRRRREESHSNGEENNESRHLDSYKNKRRHGGDGGEGERASSGGAPERCGTHFNFGKAGRKVGGRVVGPTPKTTRQRRVLPETSRRGRRRRHSAAPAKKGGRETDGLEKKLIQNPLHIQNVVVNIQKISRR